MSVSRLPLVSVIVPVYNVQQYVDECLSSIRSQSHTHLEIIVVEDCSTDDSLSMLQSHLTDPRVRLLRHAQNSGLSAARNTGIEAASGDYVMFVDSDDIISAGLVSVALFFAAKTRADVVTYEYIKFNNSLKPNDSIGNLDFIEFQANRDAVEYFQQPNFAWLKFVKRSAFAEHDLVFPVGVYYEDYLFNWKIGISSLKTVHVQSPLYFYREREFSITGTVDKKVFDIFTSYQKIIDLISEKKTESEKELLMSILRGKIMGNIWFIYTNIDSRYIPDLTAKVKKFLIKNDVRSNAVNSIGNKILLSHIRSASPLSVVILKLLNSFVSRIRGIRSFTKK